MKGRRGMWSILKQGATVVESSRAAGNFRGKSTYKLVRGSLQQIDQLIFPERGHGVAPMAACFLAQRNHDRAPFRHTFNLALEDAELRRVDQVVGGIDRQQRGAD